jgi:hypothetical protein
MNYFVLKRGEILGPFLREDLLAQIEGNVFDESDLGQIEGSAHWTPLRLLLHGDAATVMEGGAIAPDWRTLGTWAFRRARHLVQSDPFRGGFFFFGIGAGTLLLSYWPAGALVAVVCRGGLRGNSSFSPRRGGQRDVAFGLHPCGGGGRICHAPRLTTVSVREHCHRYERRRSFA